MEGKSASELREDWERAKEKLDRLRADYGFIAQDVKPGEEIARPPKALTPEAIEEIQKLEEEVDELWTAYRQRVSM